MEIFLIITDIPAAKAILAMLEPKIFPNANILWFFIKEFIEINNSGADVPIATIVNPTAKFDIPNLSDIPTAPSIKKIEPK